MAEKAWRDSLVQCANAVKDGGKFLRWNDLTLQAVAMLIGLASQREMEISLGLVQKEIGISIVARPSSRCILLSLVFTFCTNFRHSPCCSCISGHRGMRIRIDTEHAPRLRVAKPTSTRPHLTSSSILVQGRKGSEGRGENGSLRVRLNWATFSFEVTF